MDRTRRCELLAQMDDDALAALHDRLPAVDAVTISGPTVGMVMMRVQEGARGELFNLGEVLVTECSVRVGASSGWAMLLGSRPRGSELAARIDAAIVETPSLAATVDPALEEVGSEVAAREAAAFARLAPTRVRFETQ